MLYHIAIFCGVLDATPWAPLNAKKASQDAVCCLFDRATKAHSSVLIVLSRVEKAREYQIAGQKSFPYAEGF